MKRIIILGILCLALSLGLFAQTTTINYTVSSADILNPERGFYTPTITYASNYDALSSSYLNTLQNSHTPFNANYQVTTTLVFRYFVLDDFVGTDIISNDFLSNMQADFDAIRDAGMKAIIRYSYVNSPNTGACGSWICPPYGDAPKSRIFAHINQLKPYWEANKDIITAFQMGFIGVWGENYYTDYFGDASQSPFILTNTNWQDRNDVLDSLLHATPIERMVQARYPQLKQRLVYGISAPTNSAALTAAEAHQPTHKARIGFHNDCFLASDTDFGTYNDYGPPVSMSDTSNLKPYLANDTKYVVMGGETCSNNDTDDDCAFEGGRADTELKRFHYSYLNSAYNNPDVNNDWTGICMEDIKKNLGYRFVLQSGTFTNEVQAGQSISISIDLENEGYAAPYNKRGLELVLRNTATGATYFAPLQADPRLWLAGSHTINEHLCIPATLPNGNYALLLNLPDPMPTLFNLPDYSIRFANTGVWEASTGYNDLGHTLVVNSTANESICSGENLFLSMSKYDPDYCEALLTINNAITTDIYVAQDQILSNGTVNMSEIVYFQAGQEIQLEEGFEVQLGALFHALIESCQ